MIKAIVVDLESLVAVGAPGELVRNTAQVIDAHIQALVSSSNRVSHGVVRPASRASLVNRALLAQAASKMPLGPQLVEAITGLKSAHFRDTFSSIWPTIEPGLLVNAALAQGLKVIIASNPMMPEAAVDALLMRMGISPLSVSTSTTLTTASFQKGTFEYFFEMLYRSDLEPYEALYVSADWYIGVRRASKTGMHTFWVQPDYGSVPDLKVSVSRIGSLEDLLRSLKSNWVNSLGRTMRPLTVGLHALRASVPVLQQVVDSNLEKNLSYRPSQTEWSARDVVCHLADYEQEQVQNPLQRIVNEENPFLAVDYDPLVSPASNSSTPTCDLMKLFVARRQDTVKWLMSLDKDAWERPARSSVFGPTSLREMAYFVVEHDKLHLRQISAALSESIMDQQAGD